MTIDEQVCRTFCFIKPSSFAMKELKFLLLLVTIIYAKHLRKIKTKSVVSNAISSSLNEYSKKNSFVDVDLIFFGVKSGKSENLVSEILCTKSYLNVLNLSKVSPETPWKNNLNKSSILIFDSVKNFEIFRDKIVWQTNNATRHQHLVHIPNVTIDDLEKIQNGFSIDNVNFLMNETEESIDLVTGFMFSSNKCRSNEFVTINRLTKSTMQWDSSIFYPDKYRNFHGCSLIVAKINNHNFLKSFDEFKTHLNFKYISKQYERTEINIIGEDVDLYEMIDSNNFGDTEGFVVGFPFIFDHVTFFIPPGELLTPLEKIFSPFQLEVWLAISVTLLIGLIAIQLINRCPLKFRNFVFGRNNTTPTLNMASTFLIGAQFKTPGRNFARFFLILFLVWSLIFRTCYQSLLFKQLQSDKRKPEVETFADLIRKNFSFYETEKTMITIKQIAKDEGLEE